MLKEKICELFNENKFDELEKFASEQDINELAMALSSIKKDLLCDILPKLPEKVSAKVFVLFSEELQKYLTENISDFEFKDISEEILESDAEESLNLEVRNEVLRMAEADTRHEKLLEIIDKIDNKNFSALKPLLSEMEPIDIADIINDIEEEKVIVLFRILPKDLASETFVEMDSDKQEILIKAFTDKELSSIIDDMFVDDTLDIIEEMPSNIVVRILRLSDKETRESINKLLGFPKDSAGSIMTTEFISLREKMTVNEALAKIRKQALDKETILLYY